MIYMGRYPDRELLLRKQEQLKRLKLPVDELRDNAALQPGLSLGRFDSKPAADAALARMVQRGLRTADATLRARLAGLTMPSGPGFVDCAAEVSAAAASAPALPASAAVQAPSAASATSPASAASTAAAASKPVAAQASAPAAAVTKASAPR
jgi:hypothetical protein